jgi:hypothetical protein
MIAFRNHRRRLRQTAWVTLLAWVFALTTGVVNACVLSAPSAAIRGTAAESHATSSSHAVAGTEHHDQGLAAYHKHEQDNGNGSCQKFCDDESSALSKDSSSALSPGVALVAAVEWPGAVVSIASVGTALSLERPTAQGPPLVIRLLRLTL